MKTSTSESCQFNVLICHKILLSRNFSHRPASSQDFLTRMASGKFSNLSLCWRTRFPWTGNIDTRWICADWHNSGCDFGFRIIIHLRHKFPCTGWRRIWNLLSKFFTPIRYCSQILSWLREIMMPNNKSADAGSPLQCTDVVPPPLLFKDPRDNALVPLNRGARFLWDLASSVQQHGSTQTIRFESVRSVPLFFSSWFVLSTRVLQEIFWRMQQHLKNSQHKLLCLPLSPNQCRCTSTWRWFGLRIVRAEFCSPPWIFAELHLLPPPSGFPKASAVLCVLRNAWTTRFCPKLHWSWITHYFRKDKTPSKRKRFPFAVDSLTDLSFNKVLIHGIVFQSFVDVPHISRLWSRINLCEISYTCLIFSKSVFFVVWIILTILSKTYRRLQCRGHKYSPDHRPISGISSPGWRPSFVVRSNGLPQNGQHSSGILPSCGETILYQWDSLSFPSQVAVYWSQCFPLLLAKHIWEEPSVADVAID